MTADIYCAIWKDNSLQLLTDEAGSPVPGLAGDVNDAGQVVGYAFDSSTGLFLWQDGILHRLSDLLADSSVDLISADLIDERGVITGTAWMGHAQQIVVLTPIRPLTP
jgi:hypothetical protein